jgi:DNA invertase Pin-like site-specific DNA recombinase
MDPGEYQTRRALFVGCIRAGSRSLRQVINVYRDHGISWAKGGDKRPAFGALCREASRREFDIVMAWSVDWLGRSLQDLVNPSAGA